MTYFLYFIVNAVTKTFDSWSPSSRTFHHRAPAGLLRQCSITSSWQSSPGCCWKVCSSTEWWSWCSTPPFALSTYLSGVTGRPLSSSLYLLPSDQRDTALTSCECAKMNCVKTATVCVVCEREQLRYTERVCVCVCMLCCVLVITSVDCIDLSSVSVMCRTPRHAHAFPSSSLAAGCLWKMASSGASLAPCASSSSSMSCSSPSLFGSSPRSSPASTQSSPSYTKSSKSLCWISCVR